MAYKVLCNWPIATLSLPHLSSCLYLSHLDVPKLTEQFSQEVFVLALPSASNVLLPEIHMACFHGFLLKSLIREVFPDHSI